jgi:DNA polymerase II small subunit/DNA polymerase delta subunit B
MKLTLKGYIAILIIIIGMIVGLFVSLICIIDEPNYKQVTYIVQAGDTLDGIADKFNRYKDKREYIYNLEQINDFNSLYLQVGQAIKILEEVER